MNSAKLQLATLRQYQSKGGRTYFLGRMGQLKLMLFEDTGAELTGKLARWTVFAEEAPDRRPAVTVTPPRRPDGLRLEPGRCGLSGGSTRAGRTRTTRCRFDHRWCHAAVHPAVDLASK